MYKDLEEIIKRSPKPAEVLRALAVKQDLADKRRQEIADILGVTVAFVSKWRLIYNEYGADGLRSVYQGGASRAFLSKEQRAAVIKHIASHTVFNIEDLMAHLQERYQIKYQSRTSYFFLLKDAGMSWHKSQKSNPRRDGEAALERRAEIKKNFTLNSKR